MGKGEGEERKRSRMKRGGSQEEGWKKEGREGTRREKLLHFIK
jgi:hypothetical protein